MEFAKCDWCWHGWRMLRRIRLSRVIIAATLLLLLFYTMHEKLFTTNHQQDSEEHSQQSTEYPWMDLVAAADRHLPAASEGDGAAVFAQLEATLNDTEPASSCLSRATLGGWCLWCSLISADADSVSWRAGLDGSKSICLDLLPAADSRRRCRVFSVGINNDFSFDRAAARLGCRVDAFDPTMRRPDGWVAERLRFHGVGLAAEAGEARSSDGHPLPLDTLDGLLRRAQLPVGPVDYLKLDIEASEWTVLEALLAGGGGALRRVGQLTMELHLYQWKPELAGQVSPTLTADTARRFLRVLQALRLAGFRLLETQPYKTCVPVAGGRCIPWIYETLWVNGATPAQ